jgi:hypothetical protein
MCDKCDNTGFIEEICINCNGSGEGMGDGSTCNVCKGKGIQIIECDCEYGSNILFYKDDINYPSYNKKNA